MNYLPKTIQNEVLEILDSNEEAQFGRSSKIRQARIIVKLRSKYSFKRKNLGLN